MYPPIFSTCYADSGVQGYLGSDPMRLYLFGEAPENAVKPYAVWQNVGGTPENYIDRSPDVDSWTIQVDVYSDTGSSVRDTAMAIRDAIEPMAHITSWVGDNKEPDTFDYRFTFLVDWFADR